MPGTQPGSDCWRHFSSPPGSFSGKKCSFPFQTELAIEEALQKAGYLPALVIMQNDSLTINVGARELSGTDSMTILSICVAHSDVPLENIRIMNGPSS